VNTITHKITAFRAVAATGGDGRPRYQELTPASMAVSAAATRRAEATNEVQDVRAGLRFTLNRRQLAHITMEATAGRGFGEGDLLRLRDLGKTARDADQVDGDWFAIAFVESDDTDVLVEVVPVAEPSDEELVGGGP